jgi:cyclopropane-fatty-acyl-phospholipid synthase
MNDITPPLAVPAAPARTNLLTRMLRQRVLATLSELTDAQIALDDALGCASLGVPDAPLKVHLRVHDLDLYTALAARGSVGAAEAYMAGHWDCDDLVALVRILVRNRALLDGLERGSARLGNLLLRGAQLFRRNTLSGSRRNIAAHYDLGNEFFALFLSTDLMYSAALWEHATDTLESASTRKLERVCGLLELTPDDHVLEIGTGWGGFALHAARHYGCRVTTTTISRAQHSHAVERIRAAGLADRVTVLLEDYRCLRGRYDKLVSIEMIEAIGARYLPTYFAQLNALVKPDGLALLQAITIEDHRYAQALRSVDFIKRYVFPGSFIPSIAAILEAKKRSSDLALIELHDFGSSYARTLEAWRAVFLKCLPQVRALGFDEHFIRLWDFYLAYCEGGFRERSIGVAHLLFARSGYRRPG